MDTPQQVDLTKNIKVDVRLESYRSFFYHAWAERILSITEGSQIDLITFDLTASFKGIANTFALPWIMAQQLNGFANGFVESRPTIPRQFLELISDRLIGQTNARNMLRKELRANLDRLLDEVISADEVARKETAVATPEVCWNLTLDNSEFQMSLWSSQRLCYGGLYYAYEDYLLRVYQVCSGDNDCKINGCFPKKFSDIFGDRLRDECLSDHRIAAAKQVRHSLVHSGGRINEKLNRMRHGIEVIDGELQIMAPDTRSLFHVLKDRSLNLAEKIISQTVSRIDEINTTSTE